MSSRYYKTDNGEYASVTTITGLVDKSDALMPWATKCMAEFIEENFNFLSTLPLDVLLKTARFHHKTVGKEARDVGSEVHDAIEGLWESRYIHLTGEAKVAWKGFADWFDSYKGDLSIQYNIVKARFERLNFETKVYNHKYQYAGTQDLKCVLDGVVSLVDWKTHGEDGKIHVPEAPMQLSAYAKCEGNHDVEQIVVVGLNKVTGKHTEKRWGLEPNKKGECIDYFFGGFLGLLDNFYRFHAKVKLRREVIDYGF